jgi:hypothetical protein
MPEWDVCWRDVHALPGQECGQGRLVGVCGLQTGRAHGEESELVCAMPSRRLLLAGKRDFLPAWWDVLAQDGPDLGKPVPALPHWARNFACVSQLRIEACLTQATSPARCNEGYCCYFSFSTKGAVTLSLTLDQFEDMIHMIYPRFPLFHRDEPKVH